jgi:outer membrane protein OmpA-like peptidoglycan-associated protein
MRTSALFLILLLPAVMFCQRKSVDRKPDEMEVTVINDIEYYNVRTINTPALDFSPIFYQNGIVYVSSRLKSGPVDRKIGETFFELFYSELGPKGAPAKPVNFSVELNSRLHEGPVCFNREGNRIFFTRNNLRDGITRADAKGRVGLKIYEAVRGEYDWENLTELPFNSDAFSCMHPSLSPDGTKIFFASDKPGGFGGFDLYVVERQGNSWSNMINLGAEVNTPGNEVFPYIHETGTLFFASDGHKGLGGMDVFSIDLSTRTWGTVTNLGEPFNSRSDDFGFILNPDGNAGFFSSDRAGGVGKDDIYGFRAPHGIRGVARPVETPLLVTVYDGINNRRMPRATLRLFERGSDGLIANTALYNVELAPIPGSANELTLRLVRKRDDELGPPTAMTNRDGEAQLLLPPGKDYILAVHTPGYASQEILLMAKSPGELKPVDIIMEPESCVTLSGNILSRDYNTRVPGALLRIVHERSGREDYIRAAIDGGFDYCFDPESDYTLYFEKDGYASESRRITAAQIRAGEQTALNIKLAAGSETSIREPLREGTVILLQNLYYDFNKSAVRTGEARELDALLRLLELFPSMQIELASHTDSRGASDYNLQLSIKRAESAKDFLVQRNVDPSRIRTVGYGETRLKNGCKDGVQCSEAEHQQNRRTEVRVIRMDERSSPLGSGN